MVQMFGPGAPPLPWDTAGEYSRQRVELYYLTHGGKALSEVRRSDASSRPGNLIPPPPAANRVEHVPSCAYTAKHLHSKCLT